ncbi:hypothetical protein GCM10018963_65920 [Saccharothrix longispora]
MRSSSAANAFNASTDASPLAINGTNRFVPPSCFNSSRTRSNRAFVFLGIHPPRPVAASPSNAVRHQWHSIRAVTHSSPRVWETANGSPPP